MQEDDAFVPVMVDREILAELHRHEVVVRKWDPPLQNQYYRSLLPDVRISLCNTCNQVRVFLSVRVCVCVWC